MWNYFTRPGLDQRAKKYGVLGEDSIDTGVSKLLDKIEVLELENQRLAKALVNMQPAAPTKLRPTLPEDDAARRSMPIGTGVLDYFPLALAEVAKVSKVGNDKHNPGEPLHWARGKSTDQANPIIRHWIQRGTVDPRNGMLHSANMAWRALALLQTELELALGYDAVAEANGPKPTIGSYKGFTFTEEGRQPKPAPKAYGGDNPDRTICAKGGTGGGGGGGQPLRALTDEEWLAVYEPEPKPVHS